MTTTTQPKLAIISTHPIQYYAPVFVLISKKTRAKVFYTKANYYDKGFNRHIEWDIPLLEGYEYMYSTGGILRDIKAFCPDYILVYGWAHFQHLRVIKAFSGKIPVLFRGDSNLLREQSIFKSLSKKLILPYIYKQVYKAIYVGTNNKAYFRQYGLKKSQLVFAPHAIDNSRFSPGVTSDVRNDLELNRHDILVLFAGKLDPIKNPEMLLKAFMQLRLPNVHLLFVGDGILKNKLQSTGAYSKKVHFIRFQNQSRMPSIYAGCDLFCLPSISESWGLSVNEAMAAGKAVLVSDKVGAAKDLVKTENGLVFRHNDLDELKVKLQALTASKSDLDNKGKASLRIIADWNFETQASNIIDALH
jgi:glycosyltransferase involved in cell wall biosynthesis